MEPNEPTLIIETVNGIRSEGFATWDGKPTFVVPGFEPSERSVAFLDAYTSIEACGLEPCSDNRLARPLIVV